jgi:Xaa-Pro aminopeptidase
MLKDPSELSEIRNAATLYAQAHKIITESLRPGLTELELAALIYKSLREGEHEGIVRFRRWDASLHPEGIVSSGPNNGRYQGML